MIAIVHGGQTGVDRGAHEAAIDNGWRIMGYMPRDQRDELGRIPPDVARFLLAHDKKSYAARTEANVRISAVALIVVPDVADPRVTPGTAKTINLAAQRDLRMLIVDPRFDARAIANWIYPLLRGVTLPLPLVGQLHDPFLTKLLVAGPRESKWQGARVESAGLIRRVGLALAEISKNPNLAKDLAQPER